MKSKSRNFFYTSCLICFLSIHLQAQIALAKAMVANIMTEYKDSLVVKNYLNQSALESSEKGKPAKWNYEIGVVLKGVELLWRSTGDPQYLQYIKKIIDHFITEDGNIRTYNIDEFNLDNIPPGRILLTLYQTYNQKKYLTAATILAHQLDWQPRTKANGYWHKHRYPYQMWLDGLYMAEPFHAEYASITKNSKVYDDIAEQFILMEQVSRDDKTGLLYHGYDESRIQRWSDPITGRSPEFWSRGMGWYLMGLVDVLELFPKNHPQYSALRSILDRTVIAIEKYQDNVSGVWWQVTNKGGMTGNFLESSGSSMFVAGILKGIRLGLLPVAKWSPIAAKGYQGILKEFIFKDDQGTYHLTKAISGAGLGGTPYRDGSYAYYISEPLRVDDLKAMGPFIQAAVEMELADMNKYAKGKSILLDRYFNNENKEGLRYHYTWEDEHDSGFSWFGQLFKYHGAQLNNLDQAPTTNNLKGSNVYIVVDPDTKKETVHPNYINKDHINVIKEWVFHGGRLLLMTNDTTNAEFFHSNELAKAFHIQFTGKNINFVKNDHFDEGAINIPEDHSIFKTTHKIYIKELVTLQVTPPAKAELSIGSDIVIASAEYGKGKVFIVGDPWLYNEYVNGRKLPITYQNYDAANDLIKWLLK